MNLHFFESEFSLAGGLLVLPVRSTVVKTSHGVIIISPIRFTKEQFIEIEGIGTVTDLVAPCLFHHLSLPKSIEHFKNAFVWGPQGSKEKLPNIPWNGILGTDLWKHQNELELMPIEGAPGMNEVAFFHKESKTLILTDFIFNLESPKGWAAPLLLRLLGTYKRLAVSRFVNKYITNKKAVEASFRNVLKWNFENLVMGHGEIVSNNAKSRFIKALNERGFNLN